MFSVKGKRGLSDVVITVIIILLSLVAIGVVWFVVSNILSEGSGEIGIEQFSIDVNFLRASVNTAAGEVSVTVKRATGSGTMTGMKFIVSDGLNSEEFVRNDALTELQERTYVLELQSLNPANLRTAEVAPIFTRNNEDITGDVTDRFTFGSGSFNEGNGNGNGGEVGCGDGTCSIDEDEFNCPADCTTASGEICGNGFCTGEETEQQCPEDCVVPESCNGVWEGAGEDPGVECEQSSYCGYNCVCAVGFSGNEAGQCVLDPPVSSGIINSTWNAIYFDSEDLPKSQVTMATYINYYVNFSNSPETACFIIEFADYVTETDISYVRLDDSLGFPNIAAGQNYQVWEAVSCGQY